MSTTQEFKLSETFRDSNSQVVMVRKCLVQMGIQNSTIRNDRDDNTFFDYFRPVETAF